MIQKKYILFYFLLLSLTGFSQTEPSPFKVWQLISLSGQANLNANYRKSENQYNIINNTQSENYFGGIFQLQTQNYFVHPNFMLFNFGGIYNPETRRNQYIGSPDYSEKFNNEGLEASTIFFQNRPFNLTAHASSYRSIQNIDNLTLIKDYNKFYGVAFTYFNSFAPFTISYSNQKNEQNVINETRGYNINQKIYQATANKSFSRFNNLSLSYIHTENNSLQNDINLIYPWRSYNKINTFSITDDLAFGSKKNLSLSSSLSSSDERGSIKYKTLNIQEIFNIIFSNRLNLSNVYNNRSVTDELNEIKYQSIRSTLSHRLFESLNSKLIFEHWTTDQQFYLEQRNKIEIDFRYLKNVRFGKLALSYNLFKEFQSVKTPTTTRNFTNEIYTLSDNQITLLNNQNVYTPSIVVKDSTGLYIYQINLDYILIDKNPYIEIVRVPGGLIANNSRVYIDYSSMAPGTFDFVINYRNFNSDIWLLKNKLNIYYKYYSQDYNNQTNTENQILNIYTKQIIGARLDLNFINGGAEYEYDKSNVLPFYGMKYFLSYQYMRNKFNFTFNSNYTNIYMVYENTRRKDLNFQGKLAYSLRRNVRVSLDYMNRSMTGRGIDVKMQSSRFEFSTNLHMLIFTTGTEYYWSRNHSNDSSYRRLYVQLIRNF